MARRHLGFTIDQWEDLPWWEQQVYAEGLEIEFGDDSYVDAEYGDDLGAARDIGVNVLGIG